jgi:hypothetical protein
MRSQITIIADAVFRARFGAAVAAVALLSGCASQETPAQPPAPASNDFAPAPGKAPDSGPASEVAPEALTGAASDGTDLAACRDAECEVEVVPGDRLKIAHKFGVNAISVKSLGTEEIMLGLEGSSGSLRVAGNVVSTTSSCSNGRCRDQGVLSLTTDRPGRINAIQLRLAKASQTRAILVLKPL